VPKPRVLARRNSTDNSTPADVARPAAAASAVMMPADNTDLIYQQDDKLQRLHERHRAERQRVALLLHNNA